MSSLTGQAWFWPIVGVVAGLPLALLLLGELHGALVRRGSTYAKPIALLRNWLLPAGAVYLLIDQLNRSNQADNHSTWTKLAATAVGFLLMLLLLSAANAALFGEARPGSWRRRMPGIFVDLGRLILIIIGIGLLLSWVWGANIGGLITAVGVTSIVIGLAVQNAVGPVISGLLLLFEQPFRLGDWLETKFGKGRVVEVNWRAVHLDTENGIQVVPNAVLAGDAFVNLSRTVAPYYKAKTTLTFAPEDPPGLVKATLLAVAENLPAKLPDVPAKVFTTGVSATICATRPTG
jgi:small-conductance mechanosensitive channel